MKPVTRRQMLGALFAMGVVGLALGTVYGLNAAAMSEDATVGLMATFGFLMAAAVLIVEAVLRSW